MSDTDMNSNHLGRIKRISLYYDTKRMEIYFFPKDLSVCGLVRYISREFVQLGLDVDGRKFSIGEINVDVILARGRSA